MNPSAHLRSRIATSYGAQAHATHLSHATYATYLSHATLYSD